MYLIRRTSYNHLVKLKFGFYTNALRNRLIYFCSSISQVNTLKRKILLKKLVFIVFNHSLVFREHKKNLNFRLPTYNEVFRKSSKATLKLPSSKYIPVFNYDLAYET